MVNKTPPMGVLYSFSITNIFHDKMDLRFFHFHMIIYEFENFSMELLWAYWQVQDPRALK